MQKMVNHALDGGTVHFWNLTLHFYIHFFVCYENILAIGTHISLCEGFQVSQYQYFSTLQQLKAQD